MTRSIVSALAAVAATAAACAATGCGAPQLAAPPQVTAPPTTAAATPTVPTCTPEEAELDATRSYAPAGPLPPPGKMPAGSTMAEIFDSGRLVAGVSADTLQFGALDPVTGELEGFDIDILKEVARAIFGEGGEDQIEYRVMTYAERLPSLESDEVDLVAHTMTINCDRWKRIAFSSTYYDAGQKILVPRDSQASSVEDLVATGGRICVPGGSTNLQEISRAAYTDPPTGEPGIEVVERPDITDCLVALQQGEVDAATGDDTVLVGLAAQDPNLAVVGDRFTEEPYGIGVRADEVDLVRFVNAVLEEIRANGRWAEIYEERVASPAVDPPQPVYGR
jgi:polar amino acid transport system substrate-binding protein